MLMALVGEHVSHGAIEELQRALSCSNIEGCGRGKDESPSSGALLLIAD